MVQLILLLQNATAQITSVASLARWKLGLTDSSQKPKTTRALGLEK
jgi:hypothetical protein